jgi:hypothetical protein
MGMSEKFKKIDRDKLPLIYRLILKVPGAEFLENCSSGIFWAMVMPVFLTIEFFLNMFILVYFWFPLNIILASIIPTTIFLIFVRISLQRFINWWNSEVASQGFKWNLEEKIQEYLAMLKNKEEKEKNSTI